MGMERAVAGIVHWNSPREPSRSAHVEQDLSDTRQTEAALSRTSHNKDVDMQRAFYGKPADAKIELKETGTTANCKTNAVVTDGPVSVTKKARGRIGRDRQHCREKA